MGSNAWIVLGLLAGMIAQTVMPGGARLGSIRTILRNDIPTPRTAV